jgi:hypothetical protein
VSQPISAITTFARQYGSPSGAARLFLHLSLTAISSQVEPNEEWVNSVLAAVKVASLHPRLTWNELSAVIAAAEPLAVNSPTLTRLLPLAKERLEELTPTQLAKRQRLCEGSSSAGSRLHVEPSSIILAPNGGSLSQDQVDNLVALDVRNCINELALMPNDSSAGFYRDLVLAGPEGRKKLSQRITAKFADISWKVNAGNEERLLKYRQDQEFKKRLAQLQAEEAEEERKKREADEEAHEQEEENKLLRQRALPWLKRFNNPIQIESWDDRLLHAWHDNKLGLQLLGKDIDTLAKTCQLPKLVKYLAFYPHYNSTNEALRLPPPAFLGEFEHPTGGKIHLTCLLSRYREQLRLPDNWESMPKLEPTPMYKMPWMRDPTPKYPTNITGGGPFVKYLRACEKVSAENLQRGTKRAGLSVSKDPNSYNTKAAVSGQLKLAAGVLLFNTVRTRYMCFCTNNALDFEEADLLPDSLQPFGIVRFTSCNDGREYITGFASAPLMYVAHSVVADDGKVHLRLGVHRNGHVGVLLSV